MGDGGGREVEAKPRQGGEMIQLGAKAAAKDQRLCANTRVKQVTVSDDEGRMA